MLRLLQSSQPVAWGIVPLTFAVLFVLGGVGQHGSWTMAEAPWWGGIAVLATARWIHVVHLESGMRTRPDAVPSWAWVLVATPCLWWTPEVWWWGSLLVSVAMGQTIAALEATPKIWDLAAAWLVLDELGCPIRWLDIDPADLSPGQDLSQTSFPMLAAGSWSELARFLPWGEALLQP